MTEEQIKRKMAENSRKWHTATSETERDRLHNDNLSLAGKLENASYNEDSGKWSALEYESGRKGATGGKKEEIKKTLERETYPSYGTREYRDWQNELKKQFEENMRIRNEEDYEANQRWIAEQRRITVELNQEARIDRDIKELESKVDKTLQNALQGDVSSMGKILKYAAISLVGIIALDKILD